MSVHPAHQSRCKALRGLWGCNFPQMANQSGYRTSLLERMSHMLRSPSTGITVGFWELGNWNLFDKLIKYDERFTLFRSKLGNVVNLHLRPQLQKPSQREHQNFLSSNCPQESLNWLWEALFDYHDILFHLSDVNRNPIAFLMWLKIVTTNVA